MPYNRIKNQTIYCKLANLTKKELTTLSYLYKKQSTYSPMLNESSDYDAYSGTTDVWDYYGLHYHDFFEFYLFKKGIPYFCVDEQVFPLKTNTLVILPPFHLHGLVSNQTSTDYERSWMYITPALMQTVGMGLKDFPDFFKDCVEKGKGYFYVDDETAEKLRNLIETLRDNVNVKSPTGRWRNALCIGEFLSIVYEIAKNSDVTYKPIVINETIQSVLAYINNHYTEDLSVSGLAKTFSLSPSYLSRSFTAYTGKSLYNYIQYRRIMLAKEMICANKPFMEVALECGFNDYSCFLRAFTKSTGKTPKEYRKYVSSLGLQI